MGCILSLVLNSCAREINDVAGSIEAVWTEHPLQIPPPETITAEEQLRREKEYEAAREKRAKQRAARASGAAPE